MTLFALRAPGVSAVLKHGSVLYLRLRSVRCRQNAKRHRSGADNFVQMVGRPHISFEMQFGWFTPYESLETLHGDVL
jgi:hypothetical protein